MADAASSAAFIRTAESGVKRGRREQCNSTADYGLVKEHQFKILQLQFARR